MIVFTYIRIQFHQLNDIDDIHLQLFKRPYSFTDFHLSYIVETCQSLQGFFFNVVVFRCKTINHVTVAI